MYTFKDIAIVILNWNGKALLEQFLPLVVKYSEDSKIYVADNASSDDSVAYLKSKFPQVEIIQNTSNGGYAKGYNDALQHVKESVFCLLNSDVEVTKNWLYPILETYNNHTDVSIIQPKLLDFNKKSHFEYAGAGGGFIDKYGYPFCRGRIFNSLEKDLNQYNDTTEVFWASGACFFIKKNDFQQLNGFDEHFFAHMEEIDLCWRAFNNNYKIMYVGTSQVYHVGGATLNAANPKKTYLNFRNSLFTLTKNSGQQLLTCLFTRMLLDGIAGLRFLFSGKPKHFFAVLKAHFSFYSSLNRLLKQRKALPQLHNYYKRKSIVLDYFIKKKQKFDCL